jgi:hypothetical protein
VAAVAVAVEDLVAVVGIEEGSLIALSTRLTQRNLEL